MCCDCTFAFAGIAAELLDHDATLVETTARKFRELCHDELQIIAVAGSVPSNSKTRAILLVAGSMLRLDIQELEGLNSMVKIAIARAQNNRIELPLLSSRVCLRKLIAMNTHGSVRVRDVKPYAACLCKSATIFADGYQALHDDVSRLLRLIH